MSTSKASPNSTARKSSLSARRPEGHALRQLEPVKGRCWRGTLEDGDDPRWLERISVGRPIDMGSKASARSGPTLPGDRGAWIKTKCLNRAEFVVVGWSDPEGSRPYVGALLLGYFEADGRLIYAGRVGTGMSQKTLATLHKRLRPLAIRKMPLAAPPPRDTRFGRPLELAKVHWVRPELVAEITYLSWPDDGLLRHTVFVGLRDDKPAGAVRRETPRTT